MLIIMMMRTNIIQERRLPSKGINHHILGIDWPKSRFGFAFCITHEDDYIIFDDDDYDEDDNEDEDDDDGDEISCKYQKLSLKTNHDDDDIMKMMAMMIKYNIGNNTQMMGQPLRREEEQL